MRFFILEKNIGAGILSTIKHEKKGFFDKKLIENVDRMSYKID
jgi:hypothetical protein